MGHALSLQEGTPPARWGFIATPSLHPGKRKHREGEQEALPRGDSPPMQPAGPRTRVEEVAAVGGTSAGGGAVWWEGAWSGLERARSGGRGSGLSGRGRGQEESGAARRRGARARSAP